MQMNNFLLNSYLDVDLTVNSIVMPLRKECVPNWTFQQDRRSYHGLVYVLDGTAQFYVESEEAIAVEKGNIIFLRQGMTYRTVGGGQGNAYRFIGISFTVLNDSDLLSLPFQLVNKVPRTSYYANLFQEVLDTWIMKDVAYRLVSKTMLQQIICVLFNDLVSSSDDPDIMNRLQPAISYIEQHYTSNEVTIELLAETTGLSVTHFRRLFKSVYRQSPLKYIIGIRINQAKDLLCSGMYSVGEVAEQIGYSNIYHFSRLFRQGQYFPCNCGVSTSNLDMQNFALQDERMIKSLYSENALS